MKKVFLYILLVNIVLASNALACSPDIPEGKDAIKKYDVIFKGYAMKTAREPDSLSDCRKYTTFKIEKLYKGIAGKTIDIHYTICNDSPISTSCDPNINEIERGSEEIIFTKKDPKTSHYTVVPFDPKFNIGDVKTIEHYQHNPTIGSLERFYGLLKAENTLIQDYDFDIYYQDKAKLLEEYGDYDRAVLAWETLIKKKFREFRKIMANSPPRYMIDATPYYKNTRPYCINAYQKVPLFLRDERFLGDDARKQNYVVSYANALYSAKKPEEALNSLCIYYSYVSDEKSEADESLERKFIDQVDVLRDKIMRDLKVKNKSHVEIRSP